MIRLENVSFRYTEGLEGYLSSESVLKNISFEIEKGEFVGLVGPSGSGKTTLIQHFNGLLKPTSGRIWVAGEEITAGKKSLKAVRKQVGIIFQFPELQFFENTVFEEVAYGPKNLGISPEQIEARIQKAFAWLNLDFAQFRDRSPFQLSEGQKRRVAIASVLVMEPEVLVFDEPTAGLDYSGVERLKRFVKNLRQTGKTVVLVSHDMDFIAELTDRVLCLKDGQVLFDGTKEAFFSDAELLRRANLKEPEIVRWIQWLRAKGIPLRENILDFEQLFHFLRSYARK